MKTLAAMSLLCLAMSAHAAGVEKVKLTISALSNDGKVVRTSVSDFNLPPQNQEVVMANTVEIPYRKACRTGSSTSWTNPTTVEYGKLKAGVTMSLHANGADLYAFNADISDIDGEMPTVSEGDCTIDLPNLTRFTANQSVKLEKGQQAEFGDKHYRVTLARY